MSLLGKELQQTITNLEKICAAQHPPSEKILTQLDELYAQQIDLIEAAIAENTDKYEAATASMKEAVMKTQEAINDLANLEKATDRVAKAINKAALLLSPKL